MICFCIGQALRIVYMLVLLVAFTYQVCSWNM